LKVWYMTDSWQVTAAVTQAQIGVQKKIGALKTLLLAKEEGLLGHIQSIEEGNLQQVYNHQSMLETSQKELLSCINATSVLVNGSSFALLQNHAEAHTANSKCLVTHETTFSSEFASVKAQKQQCSFSQSAFANDFIGCLTELHPEKATLMPVVSAEDRHKRIESLKGEMAQLQAVKSEVTSTAKYLEATALKQRIDSLRFELEGLQAASSEQMDFKKATTYCCQSKPVHELYPAPAVPPAESKEAALKEQQMQLEYLNAKYEYMNPTSNASSDDTCNAPEPGRSESEGPPLSTRSKNKASAELEAYQYAQTNDKSTRGNILSLFL